MTELSTEEIASRIPHRYENLLLDQSILRANDESDFSVSIDKDDSLGRSIFFYEHANQNVLPTPILTEIAALACIVSSGAIKPGTFAYFAAISNFSITGTPFKAGIPISGTSKKVSDKNGFFKYAFEMSSDDSNATGQLMAYYDTSSNDDDTTALPKISISEDIAASLSQPIDDIAPFKNKSAHMTFASAIHHITDSSGVYSYIYPKDHPFIKGHFPGNPVMMGVCQWQMVEDSFCDFARRQQYSPGHHKVNAIIFKSDLTPVCDIKGASLELSNGSNGIQATTQAVKKVLFKQRVFPGDHLFISFDIQS